MKNLLRRNLIKKSLQERQQLMSHAATFIRSSTSPEKIIFFGSITRDDFDDFSDIDVIAIYPSLVLADQAPDSSSFSEKQANKKYLIDRILI